MGDGNQSKLTKKSSESKKCSILIVCATRQCARAINDSINCLGDGHSYSKSMMIGGGASCYSNIGSLRSGVDICIATPGRLVQCLNNLLYCSKIYFVRIWIL